LSGKRSARRARRQRQRGQAIVLVAVAFVVLLGFVGLTTDVGTLFIYMGQLRRATDAASLAAAGQYREGRGIAEMKAAAEEVIHLNGIDPHTYAVTVDNCQSKPGDPALCTTPKRKLVRVDTSLDVPMSFLSLVGVHDITISANSVGEAASLDVVLVIDLSESMTWDKSVCDGDDDDGDGVIDDGRIVEDNCGTPIPAVGDPDDYLRDPSVCNHLDPTGALDGNKGECQPFEEVKRAATTFVTRILNKPAADEEDRLHIVTFANGWSADMNLGTHHRLIDYSDPSNPKPRWTSDASEAIGIIDNLQVFEPDKCFEDDGVTVKTYWGPCRDYEPVSGKYLPSFYCYSCNDAVPPDLSAKSTTNIGGGLRRAGNMFAYNTREDALWVVVLLTDGMANATDIQVDDTGFGTPGFNSYPIGYCPNDWTYPLCQDENVASRHAKASGLYDADDYARDMADFVACTSIKPAAACAAPGQGAIIFTIGLGSGVLDTTNEAHGKPYGASLLRYIASVGYSGDPDPALDPCQHFPDYTSWCGNYYFSPQGSQLTRVFEDIASRIFTRLTH
jgi:Flp pilus assembly protein TadG